MTAFEIGSAVLLLVMLGVVGAVVFQVRAIAREVRAESRDTRAHVDAGLSTLHDMQHAELEALREFMTGRAKQALSTLREAEAISKPHRHQWRFNSEERTNKQIVRLHVCTVAGCRDVYREEEPEGAPKGGDD